ncbi:NADPH-dependent FMN reductase [Natrinema halophilum]|uniref:NADPH-dependent FMN reductase n=1 Tax=Natrinema halophilum TaxID=1699371 RepID=UPI001F22758C|nr:NAD(P)H-dependent oxidoreductase [Natrinema halophilum]UHQ96329.1 NAD(P)H-dependent oxidoreductase [Natrinema halophilum]
MTTVLGIVGSPLEQSKTQTAVEVALEAITENSEIKADLLSLSEYDMVTADGRMLEDYTGDTAQALNQIVESDAYIIGTPVYRAAYSGLLKNLFDMIPRGQWQADVAPLENSAVGLIATGATAHHYLSIDTTLRPIMAFFGAHCVGGGVYMYSDHFDEDIDGEYMIVDTEMENRLQTLGLATADLADAVASSEALSEIGPQL